MLYTGYELVKSLSHHELNGKSRLPLKNFIPKSPMDWLGALLRTFSGVSISE